jgi:Flp pilus assembly protein TadD
MTLVAFCLAVSIQAQAVTSQNVYADPSACKACHAAIAETYSRTPMARSFGRIDPGASIPPLKQPFRHEPSNQTFSLASHNNRTYLRREEATANNILEKQIDYWFGSGNHARSYISRTAAGDLVELPLTWYAENGGYWAMSPAYDYPQHAGFSRKITYRCMFCHNAYPSLQTAAERLDNATRWPQKLPQGIDCQRCHGPGLQHVKSPTRANIINPARLSTTRQSEVCPQCHLETTNAPLPAFVKRANRPVFSYKPGEPLEDYGLHFDHAPGTGHDDKFEFAGAPYRLHQSACYLKSNNNLTCTTCHNPHATTSTADYDRACKNCHPSLSPTHEPKQDCTTCHMSKGRPDDAIHVTITDHRISARPPRHRPDPPVERNGSNTPPYRGPVRLYYPKQRSASNQPEPPPQEQQQPDLRKAIALTPWNNELHKQLAASLTASGRTSEALEVLKAAVAADPDAGDLHSNLGLTLQRMGDLQAAEKSLREAVRLRPEIPAIRVNLGTLLARTNNNWPAAKYEFEQALRSTAAATPEVTAAAAAAEVHSAYGTALMAHGDLPQARQHFETALRIKPELWNTHNNLGTLLEKIGDRPLAIQHYRMATSIRPDFAVAHYNLGIALAAAHTFTEARHSLETAQKLANLNNDRALSASAQAAIRRLPPR